ncbi:hypothetical protein [Saccharopolyspora shandongensis]|uniref:hypothetical protein n=1 Tax=Saccharopolyspora shandongensis TaxID=418495 RepID=UPI0033DB155B
MNLIPEHRALLGVDVVGSASNPGYHLNAVAECVDELLCEALATSGIPRHEVVDWESTGDGALLALPSRYLGRLLDCSQHLDALAAVRNRWQKPEICLRIAIEIGPVGGRPGFYAAKIALSRMLEAKEFKALFGRCREETPGDVASSALIVSEKVLGAAFGGDHTDLVRRSDFAALPLRNKEHSDTAWVRVPGFDPRSLDSFVSTRSEEGAQRPSVQVSNTSYGTNQGVQAHTVNGGVTFGAVPR